MAQATGTFTVCSPVLMCTSAAVISAKLSAIDIPDRNPPDLWRAVVADDILLSRESGRLSCWIQVETLSVRFRLLEFF